MNLRRFQKRHVVGLLGLAVACLGGDIALATGGHCERNRITNLHYECKNPGASCGLNCVCKDVSGGRIVAWKDCKCKPSGGGTSGAPTVLTGGSWAATAIGPFQQNSSSLVLLEASGADLLELFELNHVEPDGTIPISTQLSGPADLTGSCMLTFGAGPPEEIPVFITELDITAGAFQMFGRSTGVNTVEPAPGADQIEGLYNELTGVVQFDEPVPCIVRNDIFPDGVDIGLRPVFESVGGDQLLVLPASTSELSQCFDADDFETYFDGQSLHGVSGWKGWDDDPAFDAPVSSAQSQDGQFSVEIRDNADLVHEVCEADRGAWSFSAWQYIPSDFVSGGAGQFAGSFFILLNTYEDGGPYHWSVQMQFDSNDGMLKVYYGNGLNTIDVPYETDRWVKIQTIIDLDNDWTQIYYDDTLVTEYQWTGGVLGGGGGELDIAAVDLFAQGSTSIYYDHIVLEPCTPPTESFEEYLPGAELHGLGGWKGWDDDPAFSAPVSNARAHTGVHSVEIAGDADLVREACTPGTDTWSYSAWQYIPSDFASGGGGQLDGSYFILLNTYHDGGPYHWSVQMQFDSNDGMLKVFHGDGLNTINVPYETDRWVKIQTIIDLDEDWTQIYYDDDLITEYQWTGGVLGGGGGALDIAAVDLFAQGSTSIFYDDLLLERIDRERVSPDSFDVIFGAYQSGTVEDLAESDDEYVIIEQRPAFTPLLPLIRMVVDGSTSFDDASELLVTVETATTAIPSQPPQRLSLFDFDAPGWEVIDERITGRNDTVTHVTVDANAGRFVEAGSGALRMRLEWLDPGNVFSPAWTVRTDQAIWTVTP